MFPVPHSHCQTRTLGRDEELCRTIEGLFGDFRNPVMRDQDSAVPAAILGPQVNELRRILRKSSPDPTCTPARSLHKTGVGNRFSEENSNRMNARPQVREILISKKMKRWWLVGKCPLVDPTCPPARARKNYARLCARYPQIMQKLGLNEFSAF